MTQSKKVVITKNHFFHARQPQEGFFEIYWYWGFIITVTCLIIYLKITDLAGSITTVNTLVCSDSHSYIYTYWSSQLVLIATIVSQKLDPIRTSLTLSMIYTYTYNRLVSESELFCTYIWLAISY